MAVSSRKVSDSRESISKGSSDDFDHSCDPCLATSQHKEAHVFCVECQEYLCETCFACHQQTKASKHHQLLDKDTMGKRTFPTKDTAICTVKCPFHINEIIKFFCTNHRILGCTDCITLNHRSCKIDYIPDKCQGIGDSDEYREMMKELDQKLKEIDAVLKMATAQYQQIDSSYEHVIQEIVKFRKEINDRFDQLQKQIQIEAEKKKLTDKQTVTKVIETCNSASSEIKKFKSILQDNKNSQQNGQLYIIIKEAKSELMLDNLKNAQDSLNQTNTQYTFERNKELERPHTKPDIFGKLNLSIIQRKKVRSNPSTTLVTPRQKKQKKSFDKLTKLGDINVKTKSDKNECWITGCAVLSSNKVILADNNNWKLKVVDTQSKTVIQEKTLGTDPWDIAVLPQHQIVVTLPSQREILVMATGGKISNVRRIQVKGNCKCITYHQGHLYVVCWYPENVHIVDKQGNAINVISLNNEIFKIPTYILVSEDCRHFFISNCDGNSYSVVSETLQGDASAVYKHKDLNGPVGMTMLDDGSLLVCCCNKTIHHISGDLRQGQTILEGLQYPQSICYNHHKEEVYIGGSCNQLEIMKIH